MYLLCMQHVAIKMLLLFRLIFVLLYCAFRENDKKWLIMIKSWSFITYNTSFGFLDYSYHQKCDLIY